ncbi:MAG TPA: gluconokinase [Caulobacterales bacterium]|nr:gluconokinase [Caulobacterales bacterium]
MSDPRWIVVMGVAGSGKSTLGAALAEKLGLPFLEGDAFHPPENVAKMAAGVALTDEDRWPWLDTLGRALREAEGGAVLACSALKAIYRARLRSLSERSLVFLWLKLDRNVLLERMKGRKGHYMPASLLDSQLATLEPPAEGEFVVTLHGGRSPKNLLTDALAQLAQM